jgi:hypothetical protein
VKLAYLIAALIIRSRKAREGIVEKLLGKTQSTTSFCTQGSFGRSWATTQKASMSLKTQVRRFFFKFVIALSEPVETADRKA